ncbi:MAG: hypothetical protein C0604_04475 [Clostridiales bacterium]|nr:MAG: hypothetical protein C0604_04475 [Clostridiales bacterium]
MKEILVLGSHCMKSSYYRDMVQYIADGMNLDLEVKKIIDPLEIEHYGIEVGCSNSYCPGCNFVNIGKDEKYTPALVVDGKVVFHSSFPSRHEFEDMLRNIDSASLKQK